MNRTTAPAVFLSTGCVVFGLWFGISPLLQILVMMLVAGQIVLATVPRLSRTWIGVEHLLVTGVVIIATVGPLSFRSEKPNPIIAAYVSEGAEAERGAAILVAALCFHLLGSAAGAFDGRHQTSRIDLTTPTMPIRSQMAVLGVSAGVLCLGLIGAGFGPLLQRVTYIGTTEWVSPTLFRIATLLDLPAVVLAVVVARVTRSPSMRSAAILMALASIARLYALGSREAVLSLLLLAALLPRGSFAKGLGVLCSVLLIGYPVRLRLHSGESGAGHGLLPYLKETFSNASLLLPDFSTDFAYLAVPTALTDLTSRSPVIEPQDLWISVAPLPGSLVDFASRREILEVNSYIPFNGVGQLYAHGLIVFTVIMTLHGLLCSASLREARRTHLPAPVIEAVTVLLCALSTVFLIQYQLRQSVVVLVFLMALLGLRRLGIGQVTLRTVTPQSRRV